MSYLPETVLKRKEAIDAPNGPHDDDSVDLSVYNDIQIIGRSPVQRSIRSEQWGGQAGDEYSVRPLAGFGEVIDVPQGSLEKDYEIVSIPERVQAQVEVRRVQELGATPEQQFAALDNGPKSEERVPTPLGPDA